MSTQPVWLPSLATLVATDQLETQETLLQEYTVDGRIPSAVVSPESVEQVAAVLQWAQREKLAVLPRGSGTTIGLGGVPKRLDIVLSMSRLAQVSDYDVANFTITAEAGMRFAQLTQLTAEHMQMLPLQYPSCAATLGGLIATNAYNPKRLRYGGVRDLLLGIRVVLASGEIAHFGGKVVKNVAGYDMCKLFLGSLGSLGVIVEATFKLYALPERDETLMAAFPSLRQGAAAVTQLRGTQLLPSQMLLLNPTAAHAVIPQAEVPASVGGTLLVSCEGMDEAVERQLADISRLCQAHGARTVRVLPGEAQLQLRRRLESMVSSSPSQPSPLAGEGGGGGPLVVRLGTLPARVHTLTEAAAQALGPVAPQASIMGDCGVGLVKLCIRDVGFEAGASAVPLLHALRELPRLVAAEGGYAVIESASPAVKAQLEVWGPPPSSFALLKALKHRFDPEGILNPGRFIGGV